jgi:hypothetical protein
MYLHIGGSCTRSPTRRISLFSSGGTLIRGVAYFSCCSIA